MVLKSPKKQILVSNFPLGFEFAERSKKSMKNKKNIICTLKTYELNMDYCETCPRDKGKKCNCKW